MGSNTYQHIERVMQSDEKRKYLLKTAKAELEAFKRKYQILTELSEVFAVIDKVNAS
jgi:predicted ATPase